ncbi:MAG TPA: hypothetical protein VHG72_13075 [Polyangia bacterium]|nr:hypothetical protein [Polyangia bacterium]
MRLAPPPAARATAQVDRILVGNSGGEMEARIRISAGPLAGLEIRLTVAGGSAVTGQLLTADAGSRETLSVVVEEIRRRLRDRGITLDLGPGYPGEGDRGREDPPVESAAADREPAAP